MSTFTILNELPAQRVSSIKTRIKTQRHEDLWIDFTCTQRVSSIKTRIKTLQSCLGIRDNLLRECLPLKQGLRLPNSEPLIKFPILRECLPLKQGLRQFRASWFSTLIGLRECLPLKQGLRPDVKLYNRVHDHTQRVSSIKTRIKTYASLLLSK